MEVMVSARCGVLSGSRRIPSYPCCAMNVRFSQRPLGGKRFQAIRHTSVDVARGLALLFGIGTKVFPAWDSRMRWNNLLSGLAGRRTAGPNRRTISPQDYLSPQDYVLIRCSVPWRARGRQSCQGVGVQYSRFSKPAKTHDYGCSAHQYCQGHETARAWASKRPARARSLHGPLEAEDNLKDRVCRHGYWRASPPDRARSKAASQSLCCIVK